MLEPTPSTSEAEPFRVSDDDLEDLASALARTMAEVRRHGMTLDRLDTATAPTPTTPSVVIASPEEAGPEESTGPCSVFILALDGEAYAAELAALNDWVGNLLLPVYGREIGSTRPWCYEWTEHLEAVALLHGLWLAWQQLTDVEAGLCGPATWHRDHLRPTLLELRDPAGPFAACTTSPTRSNHRILAAPAPERTDLAA